MDNNTGTWCSSQSTLNVFLNRDEGMSLGSKSHRPIGRWIINEKEIREHAFFAPRLHMDVSFILRKEVDSVLAVVVNDNFQKADDAAALTHLWSLFFWESFLDRFQKGQGQAWTMVVQQCGRLPTAPLG